MRTTALLLALSLPLAPLGFAEAPKRNQLRIKAPVANVRVAASTQAAVSFQVRVGETLWLIDATGDWYHVETSTGKQGYVYKPLAEIVTPPPEAAAPAAPVAAAAPTQQVTIDHQPVGCVVAERYPKIAACFTPDSNVARAQIRFRAAETEPWYAVEMKPDSLCYATLLPKPARNTRAFQYYVDVVDRGFQETAAPTAGPQAPYGVEVVRNEGDCDRKKLVAAALPAAAAPVVVSIVQDAAGRALDSASAKLLEGRMQLVGFSRDGVVASATGAPPSTPQAQASGGGLPTKTLVLGGAAAAVVVGAVVLATRGEAVNPLTTDDDHDGFSENLGDCNDTDPSVNPNGRVTVSQVVSASAGQTVNCNDKPLFSLTLSNKSCHTVTVSTIVVTYSVVGGSNCFGGIVNVTPSVKSVPPGSDARIADQLLATDNVGGAAACCLGRCGNNTCTFRVDYAVETSDGKLSAGGYTLGIALVGCPLC